MIGRVKNAWSLANIFAHLKIIQIDFFFSFLLICVIASAYLEGDRTITCALKQQLKLRVFDLNAMNNNPTKSDLASPPKSKAPPQPPAPPQEPQPSFLTGLMLRITGLLSGPKVAPVEGEGEQNLHNKAANGKVPSNVSDSPQSSTGLRMRKAAATGNRKAISQFFF